MNKKEYSSNIKKTPYEYLYSKLIGCEMVKGALYKELYSYFVTEEKLPIISDQRRREVFNVIYERLNALDDFLLNSFVTQNITTSKFILTFAIAKNDSLFLEFLLLFYRNTLLGNKNYISISDFDEFFNLIKEKNAIVANWSDKTITQLSGGYRNILVESGLGYRNKKNIYTNKIIVDPSVVKHIEEIGEIAFLQAALGVE